MAVASTEQRLSVVSENMGSGTITASMFFAQFGSLEVSFLISESLLGLNAQVSSDHLVVIHRASC